jgi:hypothetical protein
VSVLVVHGLEVVEVDQDQGVAPGQPAHPLVERAAAADPGQQIRGQRALQVGRHVPVVLGHPGQQLGEQDPHDRHDRHAHEGRELPAVGHPEVADQRQRQHPP